MTEMDKHIETFKDEAYELLTELETSLLELEQSPDDTELTGRVFRAMHTIKGSGAMFGFTDIAEFTHDIENVFEQVRAGKIAVSKELINLTLSARDQIKAMLDAYSNGEPADGMKTREILASFKRLLSDVGEKKEAVNDSTTPLCNVDEAKEDIVYRISFYPSQNIFSNGTNPIYLLGELRELGDCRIVAYIDKIPLLADINPELCYTYWDIILTTDKGVGAVKDIFMFVADEDCKLEIKAIDDNGDSDEIAKLGTILVDRGIIKPDDLQNALSSQKRVGEILIDSGLVSKDSIESALIEQSQIRKVSKKRQSIETIPNIRVPAFKLDHFVNLVGELVIIQQRLSQTAFGQNNSELLSIAEAVERLTEELRDSAFSVRMLPIGTTFDRLKRLVRDLSNELGREVKMTTYGEETELDKTVIDQLGDPLVHIIRNSIDHGIEDPDVREAAGKPRQGTIHLSSIHSGSNVIIQIKDDGKGMDLELIRAKAIERGLVSPDAELTDKECYSHIFSPGFSTAKKVTSVSGRGVGMDVVKRGIDSLRGTIEVNSQCGVGTTITIKLPLTLAIIEGLQVEIGNEYFVMPLSMVEECMELTREDIMKSNGRNMVYVRGEIIPYIRLKELFLFSGETVDIEQIVIARSGDRRIGFVVDRVIGEHQTVIKTLGKVYRDIQGISGATILGDGQVAMILDIPQLIQTAEHEEHALCA